MSLAQWQDAVMRALWTPSPADGHSGLDAQPAFAVYRNTVTKGCLDALAANYPAVLALVGEAWFRAAAAVYLRSTPPVSACLLDYGDDFRDFLAGFEPAREVPAICAMAALDRQWTEAHLAPDAPALDLEALRALDAATLGALRLAPHPAARWQWHEDLPAYTLWSLNRGFEPMPADGLAGVDWHSEGVLTTRRDDTVVTQACSRAICTLLDACAARLPFGEAARRAIEVAPESDLVAVVASVLRAGALAHQAQPRGSAR